MRRHVKDDYSLGHNNFSMLKDLNFFRQENTFIYKVLVGGKTTYIGLS